MMTGTETEILSITLVGKPAFAYLSFSLLNKTEKSASFNFSTTAALGSRPYAFILSLILKKWKDHPEKSARSEPELVRSH